MALTITDAERTFYEEVLATIVTDPHRYSLSDLRMAFYLASLDGAIGGGGGGGDVPSTRQIAAGTGLEGGGTLAADRIISLSSSTIASLEKADSALQSGNGSAAGVEYYPSVGDLPPVGTAGVIYFVDAV